MTKKNVFIPIFAVVMLVVFACSFIFVSYSKINTGGGTANIGGEIMTDTTKSPQEYLDIINNYTLQNSQLKAELSSSQAEYDKKVAETNAEILQLQTELNELTEQDAQLIAEKNARIETLKEYISVLENEQAEKNAEYENEIERLNNIIADYQTKVIERIKLPEGFVFTTLGFDVIDNNSFVFYSKSHSCNLYYYDFTTKITVTIPIKTTSFNSFYKIENLLFFRASNFLYAYDFLAQKATLLCSSNSSLTYIEDNDFVYMFDYNKGFATYNKSTNEFANSLSSSSTTLLAVVYNLENYILYSGKGSNLEISLFDKETNEFTILVENLSYQATYFNIVNNELLGWSTPNLYKIDLETKTATLVGEIPSSNSTSCDNFFELNNKLVCFTKAGVYCYFDNEITNLSTSSLSSYNLHFITISENVFYICDLYVSGGASSCPLFKLDLENLTFENLSSIGAIYDYYEINNYEILLTMDRFYFIDKTTGSIDFLSLGGGSSNTHYTIEVLDCGDYVVFFRFEPSSSVIYNKSSLFFFDKINNVYGQLSTKISYVLEVVYKNNLLYVLTTTKLYSLSLTDPTTFITNLTIDGTLSSLKTGVVYSSVGTLNGSNLYVKYILQDDGTLVKSELVVI